MKRLLGALLLLLVSVACFSQDYDEGGLTKELGISLSAMNCITDVGGDLVDRRSFRLGAGIYFAAIYNQTVGLRLEATLGTVTSSDARANKALLKGRNLDFTSSIAELSLLAEVHPLNLIPNFTPALSPYILGGIGYFSFNPRTQLNGRWVYLQPLHTEGQGFPETGRPNYKLSQLNIPVGGGLQYHLSERFTLRGEAVYRFLNTDYLDDVSTTYIDPALFDKNLTPYDATLAKRLADRSTPLPDGGGRQPGSPRGGINKDAYYSVNIKLGVKIDGNGNARGGGKFYRKGRKNKTGCYVF